MDDQSVNLVVKGQVRWQGLIDDLAEHSVLKLARVDLQDPATVPRRGLIEVMLGALGTKAAVPPPPEDLPELGRVLSSLGRSRVALYHFDMAPHRTEYDVNLFGALRYFVRDKRRLVLFVQSRTPFLALLPRGHPLSDIDLKTVELQALP